MVDTNICYEELCQAAINDNEIAINYNILSDILFRSMQNDVTQCDIRNLSNEKFQFNSRLSYLIIHLNISSLQAHFDELNEFLNCFVSLPSVILPSEI